MSFSDEQRDRLKACIPNAAVAGGLTISYEEWRVLLARLEAAELPLQWANRIGHMQGCNLYHGSAICSCGFHQFYSAYEAWRKACGL